MKRNNNKVESDFSATIENVFPTITGTFTIRNRADYLALKTALMSTSNPWCLGMAKYINKLLNGGSKNRPTGGTLNRNVDGKTVREHIIVAMREAGVAMTVLEIAQRLSPKIKHKSVAAEVIYMHQRQDLTETGRHNGCKCYLLAARLYEPEPEQLTLDALK